MRSPGNRFLVASVGLLWGQFLSVALPLEPLYSLPRDYYQLLLHETTESLYLTLPAQRAVVRRSLTSGEVTGEVTLSLSPTSAAITPNGRRLFVGETRLSDNGYPLTTPGKIAELDPVSFTLVREWDYPFSPRALVARDDYILVVGNPSPVTDQSEIRLFNGVTGEMGGRLVITDFGFSLDPRQDSLFGNGVGNVFRPNGRAFIITEPLGFGIRRYAQSDNMVGPVYPSPDGQLLVCGGAFYRGAPDDATEDLRFIRAPTGEPGFFGVARFEPPEGSTFLVAGHTGIAFYRRDTLERFAVVASGNTLDAAYVGDLIYAVVLRDWDSVNVVRFPNPALGIETNQPPLANLSFSPASPTDRDEVVFDASGSADDNTLAAELEFRWDFDSDGVFETGFSQSPFSRHRFLAAGPQRVTVEVSDRFAERVRTTVSFEVVSKPDPGEPASPHSPWQIPLPATELVFDPVRPVLYAVNLTNQSLHRMELQNGVITHQWHLDAMVSSLAIQPNGERLYLGLTTNDPSLWMPPARGWLAEFDLIALQRNRAFKISMIPLSLTATDQGALVVAGLGNQREIHLYNAGTGELKTRLNLLSDSRLALHPHQANVYAAAWGNPSTLHRFWLVSSPPTLRGPVESPRLSGGRVFPLPNGTNLITAGGELLSVTPDPVPDADMHLVRDLGFNGLVGVMPLADRGLIGLLQWTGWLTNSLVFLRSDLATEVVRLPADHQTRELAVYGDHYYLAVVTRTNTWVERRRIPASDPEHNLPPLAAMSAPAPDTIILLGQSIDLRAEAADEDGIVTAVRFLANDTQIGEGSFPGYNLHWTPTEYGTYRLSAMATDNWGAEGRSPAVTLIVNAPPTITLSDPSPPGVLFSPAAFSVIAEVNDPDGTIAEVQFWYQPDSSFRRLLATLTTPPYRLEVNDLIGTDGKIEVMARDNLGATAQTSKPISLRGLPGDDWRRPLLLTGTQVIYRTNNLSATRQTFDRQFLVTGADPDHTLWWEWTAPADGLLRLSTQGSSFPTFIGTLVQRAGGGWQLGGLSFDTVPQAPTSLLKLYATTGSVYRICVGSRRSDETGLLTLGLDFTPDVIENEAPPPNDHFADRIPLSGTRVQTQGTNRGATAEPGEPQRALWPSRHSVWWSWTVPGKRPVSHLDRGQRFRHTNPRHSGGFFGRAQRGFLQPGQPLGRQLQLGRDQRRCWAGVPNRGGWSRRNPGEYRPYHRAGGPSLCAGE